jgi:hypothetical protein
VLDNAFCGVRRLFDERCFDNFEQVSAAVGPVAVRVTVEKDLPAVGGGNLDV